MNCRILSLLTIASITTLSPAVSVATLHPWYVSASAGIFQGLFNAQYNDLSDTIAQNIRQPVTQNSYNAQLAVGYSKMMSSSYLFGGELAVYGATYHANFASGASSTAFTDMLSITANLDLSVMPGFLITDTLIGYGKAGISSAKIDANIVSPTGYTPTYTTSNNTKYALGVVLGLGLKKYVSDHAAMFVEYDYHDYGTINFSNFQNFTATYSHSAHVYSQNLNVGASYLF